MADETTQGVHPFTIAWWNRLPAVYRRADRVQGYRIADAWHGLNRDPRFITGWDGWYRANTSTEPWVASVSFTRTFRATPNVPVHIRSWHHPVVVDGSGTRVADSSGVTVEHVIRNHTGTVVGGTVTADGGTTAAGDEVILDGGGADGTTVSNDGYIEHHSVVTPDRFGIIHVSVHVSVAVPDARDFMDAVHVGHQDVTFEELPGVDYFTTASAYPLLRFMDGMGHQAGYLSDYVNGMHEGSYTDPVTAPEASLTLLAAVLGVPRSYYTTLTPGELREHLVDLVEGNYPIPGSREHIAITAQQWLTGTKDVSVAPAHSEPGYITPAEQDLADAMGYTGRVHRVWVSEQEPYEVSHRWTGTAHLSESERVIGARVIAENRVVNPSFEVNTSHWFAYGTITRSTVYASTGSASLEWTPDSASAYIGQSTFETPTLTGTHVFRIRLRSEAARGVRQMISIKYADGTSAPTVVGATVVVPAGEWVTLRTTFEVAEGETFRVGLQNDDPSLTTIWVDAVYAAHHTLYTEDYFDGSFPNMVGTDTHWTGTVDASPSRRLVHGRTLYENLVWNPRFQLGTTYWSPSSGVTATRDTAVFETGVASVRLNPTGADWYWLEVYRTTPEPGEHVVRFRVKADTARTVRTRVWQYDGGTTTSGPSVSLDPGVWTWVETSFTITNSGHRYRVSLQSDPGDADTTPLWVDRVYAARTEHAVAEYFDGDSRDSTTDDIWVKSSATTGAYTWDGSGWVPYTTTTVTAEIDALLADRADGDKNRQCTLIVYAKANEVPGNDLVAFEQFLNDSGVIPAGHRVIARERYPTWDQWEEASGATWNSQAHVITTWNDSDSAGVEIN